MKDKHLSTTLRFFIRSLLTNCLLMLLPLLLIGVYSIARTTRESTQEADRRADRMLHQADDILETFYTHVDNAYLFFDSNPRVMLQLKNAFSEPSLSLESIKSAESIALNFQNLIYTDKYLQNIYVYYKNDYSRIFVPLSAKLISFATDKEEQVLEAFHHTGTEDVWMEFSDDPLLYTESSIPSLMMYRKLYRRTTDIQNGLVIFGFNAGRLKSELEGLLEYEDQQIFLIDTNERMIWPTSNDIYSEKLLSLSDQMATDYEQTGGSLTSQNYDAYMATWLPAPRSYGFSFLLLTPKNEIYKATIGLTGMYIFITLAAIVMACMLAFFKTRHDYKYLSRIINTFSAPDIALKEMPPSKKSTSPFEYILLNVIRLFIEQDYLKVQEQLSKMQALQHQINPHFLHNTLNSIYWDSVKLTGSENQCSRMISDLSAIMRYSLSDPGEDVKIQNEIDYLKKYLEIMALRYVDKFDATFDIAPDCSIYPIKKMLLQPLVENAIYHGIKEKHEKGQIRVSVHRKRNHIFFNIYDTGMGISVDKLAELRQSLALSPQPSNQHIGLINTNSRLILSYGTDSVLHINSRYGDFTVIWFSIPCPEEMT